MKTTTPARPPRKLAAFRLPLATLAKLRRLAKRGKTSQSAILITLIDSAA